MTTKIMPLPLRHGIGFTSSEPVPDEMARDYRYENVGRYHNYHCTAKCWAWPEPQHRPNNLIIDAFSPNLNKELHVGHLRQLALAASLRQILAPWTGTKFVALLGCSLGVTKAGLDGWQRWAEYVGYRPEVYYDCALPTDVVPTREPTVAEIETGLIDPNEGDDWSLPRFWDGPEGPVLVTRSNGRHLYAMHDLAFAAHVGPTHYITGHEQQEHFRKLGMGDKHLPMGLVLGVDGKKLKSRDGSALLAAETLDLVLGHLRGVPEARGWLLAWNILAWNFLHAARPTDLRFEAEKWSSPDAPGLYITYTYARVLRALPMPPEDCHGPWGLLDAKGLTDGDVRLLGLAAQQTYYANRAAATFDPAPLANYAYDLAREMGRAYDGPQAERIAGGRIEFQNVLRNAVLTLSDCMKMLGMFPIPEV